MPQKSTRKITKQKHQQRALDPSKWSSRRCKTLGLKNRVFCRKNENEKNVSFLCWGLWPRTLYFTSNSSDFMNKKRCTFGGLFSSIWEPHVAQTLFLIEDFDDF